MTPSEVALTAALGASFLTGFASLGVIWFQDRRRQNAANKAALHAAYVELLRRSDALVMRAQFLGLALERQEEPAASSTIKRCEWLPQDMTAMDATMAEIWLRADVTGTACAQVLVNECMALIGACVQANPEEQAARDRAADKLKTRRMQFVGYARFPVGDVPSVSRRRRKAPADAADATPANAADTAPGD
jgi:hypothetical protein